MLLGTQCLWSIISRHALTLLPLKIMWQCYFDNDHLGLGILISWVAKAFPDRDVSFHQVQSSSNLWRIDVCLYLEKTTLIGSSSDRSGWSSTFLSLARCFMMETQLAAFELWGSLLEVAQKSMPNNRAKKRIPKAQQHDKQTGDDFLLQSCKCPTGKATLLF